MEFGSKFVLAEVQPETEVLESPKNLPNSLVQQDIYQDEIEDGIAACAEEQANDRILIL